MDKLVKGVSVIVCCYNSEKRLPETLRHLAKQKINPVVSWEVIIVDNASADRTAQVAAELWREYKGPDVLKIVYQANPGLNQAREKGIEVAKYEYILFCDDDNWLDQEYIIIAFKLMENNPSIGVAGGLGTAHFEVPPPGWLERGGLVVAGPQAHAAGKVEANYVFGAGAVFRKSVYQGIRSTGYQNKLSDRIGNNLSSGGDYELCYLFAMAGYDIWYEPDLKFGHFYPISRMSWDYYMRFLDESIQCFNVLDAYSMVAKFDNYQNTFMLVMRLTKIILYYKRQWIMSSLRLLSVNRSDDSKKIHQIKARLSRKRIHYIIRHFFNIRMNYRYGYNLKYSLKKMAHACDYRSLALLILYL
jgi:glycosyltransferase involved in cell wall biosynthesis